MKKITVYRVNTWGGQIIYFQEPQKITIEKTAEVEDSLTRYGVFWDKYANYYKTMKRAKAAINWAMYN